MTITQLSSRRPTTSAPALRSLRPVPDQAEARGFALYVGIDEVTAAQAGVSLAHLVAALKQTVAELVPASQTHATVALAPRGAGGRDVDVVRLALHDPAALHDHQATRAETGVVVDLTRQHVTIRGTRIALTEKEFQLLAHLIDHEGETVPRTELLSKLWGTGTERPSLRTIDVHVRRLRAKLGEFQEIIHTVRGVGYRFDRHADVAVQAA